MLNLIDKKTKKSDVLKAYENYQDTQPHGFEGLHRTRVEPVLCEIPYKSKVLDIGCNSGEFMKILKEGKDCDVTGIDVSPGLVAKAKDKGLRAVLGDVESLPFDDNTFDVVVCMELLIHVHDQKKAVKEMKRVLKKDGMLLGSTPHANIEKIAWEEKAMHHRYPDEKQLRKLLKVFSKTHIKTLVGSQFNISWLGSTFGDKDAEMLFKCGGKNTKPWEHGLTTDKKTLRAFFGQTQTPGDVYYRMVGFADKMRLMKDTEIAYQEFKWNSNEDAGSWQQNLIQGEHLTPESPFALNDFENLLKIGNPWVFQLVSYTDMVDVLHCAKDLIKGKKLVTEIDDWLFDVPAYNVASNPYRPNSQMEKNAYEQIEISDAVIVSTGFIKEGLSKIFPKKPIYIVPNSIDFAFWDSAKPEYWTKTNKKVKAKGNKIRIGYTGCGNHSGDLEIIKPVLMQLLKEHDNLEILMAQEFACFKDIKHPRFKNLGAWSPIPLYPSMLKSWDLDIGIAPLRDNNFNRAKSNLRWLEYSALKIPSVMSKVRPFEESVIHNVTGFLCKSHNDWYKALKELIISKEQRVRIGNGARKYVHRHFNMDDVAKRYRNILQEIKNEPRRNKS